MGCHRGLVSAVGLVLLLANLGAGGCGQPPDAANDIVFRSESDPKPPRLGTNTFTIDLAGGQGQALAGAHVALEADMSHAGMSPAFGEAKEIAPGRYQGKLDLNMRGDWIVLFHITLANGRAFDRQVKIQDLQAN